MPNVEVTGDTKAQLLGRPVDCRVGGWKATSDYLIEQAEYRKVMDEIIDLSASLNLGEVVSEQLVNLRESGAGLVHLFRDVVPAVVAGEKNIVFRLYPSEGLIGVLLALRAKNRERSVG